MNSFDKMFGWFPHTSREWVELITAAVLLWLLMMVAISELELNGKLKASPCPGPSEGSLKIGWDLI